MPIARRGRRHQRRESAEITHEFSNGLTSYRGGGTCSVSASLGTTCGDPAPSPRRPLTVVSSVVRILMIRFPARPSRLKPISIPMARKGVCARRNRPASARGFWGQPLPLLETPSLARSAPVRSRSAALPTQVLRSAMISRTRAATGSASTAFATAALRLAHRRARRCRRTRARSHKPSPKWRSPPCAAFDRGARGAAPAGHAPPHRAGRPG